eukprot:GDKK01014608.1.p1 GENE.GDKK01014608.1~~GDKK01014608.1.p1  ORF type:complete len:641 (+),score=172.96 GDKK01014608.1:151-1923(+)
MNEVVLPFFDDVGVDDNNFESAVVDYCNMGFTDSFLALVLSPETRELYFDRLPDRRRELCLFQDTLSPDRREMIMIQAPRVPSFFSKIVTAKLISTRHPNSRTLVLVHTKQSTIDGASHIWNSLLQLQRYGMLEDLKEVYKSLEQKQIWTIAELVVQAFSNESYPANKEGSKNQEDAPMMNEVAPSSIAENRMYLRSIRAKLIDEKRRQKDDQLQSSSSVAQQQKPQQQQQPHQQQQQQLSVEALSVVPLTNIPSLAAQRPLPSTNSAMPPGSCQVVLLPLSPEMEAPPLPPSFEAMMTACGVIPTWTTLRQQRDHLIATNRNSENAGDKSKGDENSNNNSSSNTTSAVTDPLSVPLMKTTPFIPLVEIFALHNELGEPMGGLDDQGPLGFPQPPSPLPDFPSVSSLRLHSLGSSDYSRIHSIPGGVPFGWSQHSGRGSASAMGGHPQAAHPLHIQQMAAWAFQQQQAGRGAAAGGGATGHHAAGAPGFPGYLPMGGYGFDPSHHGHPQSAHHHPLALQQQMAAAAHSRALASGMPGSFPRDGAAMTPEQHHFYQQQILLAATNHHHYLQQQAQQQAQQQSQQTQQSGRE